MKKNILFMFMAAAVWSSCSKNEIESPVIDDANEIKVSSSLVDVNASTRAPYESTISSTNTLTALVLATTTNNDYSTLYAAGQMTFKDEKSTAYDTAPQVSGYRTLPGNDNPFYLSGLYPAAGWIGINAATPPTTVSGVLTLPLTGTEDVLYAEQVPTSRPDILGGTFANLEFEHQLTYLKLLVYGNETATDANRTKIKSVTLEKANNAAVKKEVTVNLNTKTVGFTEGVQAGTLPFYQITAKEAPELTYEFADVNASYIVLPGDAVAQAYVLAPSLTSAEVSAGAKDYTLKVEYYYGTGTVIGTNLELRTVYVDVDLKNESTAFTADTKGNQFNITLQFTNSGEIKAKATVVPWTEVNGTNGTVDV